MKSEFSWRILRAGASASSTLHSRRLTVVNQGFLHCFRHSDLHRSGHLGQILTQALIRQQGWAETVQFMSGEDLDKLSRRPDVAESLQTLSYTSLLDSSYHSVLALARHAGTPSDHFRNSGNLLPQKW